MRGRLAASRGTNDDFAALFTDRIGKDVRNISFPRSFFCLMESARFSPTKTSDISQPGSTLCATFEKEDAKRRRRFALSFVSKRPSVF